MNPPLSVLDTLNTALDVWAQKVRDYDYSQWPQVGLERKAEISEAREWVAKARKERSRNETAD